MFYSCDIFIVRYIYRKYSAIFINMDKSKNFLLKKLNIYKN